MGYLPTLAHKRFLGLLALSLAFVGGCRRAAAPLDVAQAMKLSYGNYDASKSVSVISIRRNKMSLPGPGEVQMNVKALFSSLTGKPGSRSFVLLTYAVPSGEGYECHACAPVIGMALLAERDGKWKLDAANPAVCNAGEFGSPPKDVGLVQIGPRQQAVKIVDIGGGQGETTAVLDLLVPWRGAVNLGLQRVIADNNQGGCEEDAGGSPCYANKRTFTFVKKDTAEYYDLRLQLSGTDMPLGNTAAASGTRQVSGTELYSFQDGKYVRTSVQGDVTSLDDFVAHIPQPPAVDGTPKQNNR